MRAQAAVGKRKCCLQCTACDPCLLGACLLGLDRLALLAAAALELVSTSVLVFSLQVTCLKLLASSCLPLYLPLATQQDVDLITGKMLCRSCLSFMLTAVPSSKLPVVPQHLLSGYVYKRCIMIKSYFVTSIWVLLTITLCVSLYTSLTESHALSLVCPVHRMLQ